MSKSEPSPAPSPAPAPEEALTLDQWAVTRSRSDNRVELLNGFVAVQRASGVVSRLPAEWDAAYLAFANQPLS